MSSEAEQMKAFVSELVTLLGAGSCKVLKNAEPEGYQETQGKGAEILSEIP
jgi:hypothetical protein